MVNYKLEIIFCFGSMDLVWDSMELEIRRNYLINCLGIFIWKTNHGNWKNKFFMIKVIGIPWDYKQLNTQIYKD